MHRGGLSRNDRSLTLGVHGVLHATSNHLRLERCGFGVGDGGGARFPRRHRGTVDEKGKKRWRRQISQAHVNVNVNAKKEYRVT